MANHASPGEQSAGDPIPPNSGLIEVHLAELKQLFNMMDPSPFRSKDLDPNADEFIVGWARELPREAPLALRVHLDRAAGPPEEPTILRDAIREFFSHRALVSRRKLRQLFRVGRTSLVIGVLFMATSIAVGDLIVNTMSASRLGDVLRESLLIGGWVAMWRPLEIFLYDWWPIRAEVRLYDRLTAMPVQIAYMADARSDAWRSDWPTALATPDAPPHETPPDSARAR